MNDLKELLDSERGKALKDYLLRSLFELKNIENLDLKGSLEDKVVELEAQKKAYLKIKEILGEVITIVDLPEKKDDQDGFAIL